MKDATPSRVLRLEVLIDGMVAVHAKQAVYTALAGVDGVRAALVELGRVEIELQAQPGLPDSAEAAAADAATLSGFSHAARQQLAEAVALAGCSIREIRLLPRQLPTL